MADRKNYRLLIDAFQSPTKLSVITILTQKGKMTVTQMSGVIGTTRSNLYQVVSELVSLGILTKPEIRAEKNYVEKYYDINRDLFENLVPENWMDAIRKMNLEDMRGLLGSFLLTQSLVLKILAEEINLATDEQMEQYRRLVQEDRLIFGYSRLTPTTYNKILNHMKGIERILSESAPTKDEEESNTFIVVGFPSLSLNK